MWGKIINFVKYNNAFTLGVMAIFMGAGISLAASPVVRDSLYSSSKVVTSVNNAFIIGANLNNFNFNLRIISVREDDTDYYVAYTYETLAIINNAWQRTAKEKTLTVNKEFLEGKDLGLYVAKQLADNINYELSYLKEVQAIQKEQGESETVVTTKYRGLVGKMIDPKAQVIKGYNPVIPPEKEEPKEEEPVYEVTIVPPRPDVLPPSPREQEPTPRLYTEAEIQAIIQRMLAESQNNDNSSSSPSPAPTPEPEPEEEEDPAPEEEIPDPTPTPEPTPEPEPEEQEEPEPSPSPTPEPEPEPTP